MPLQGVKGYEDFKKLSLTRIGSIDKPVKSEESISATAEVCEILVDGDETIGQQITLDTEGRPVLEVYGKATTATNFYLDVSPDGNNWVEGYKSWSSVTEVKDGYFNAFRYIRLRSDPAGAAGDVVTLILSATR